MEPVERRIMEVLVGAGVLCVSQTRPGLNGSGRPSAGPVPRIIDLDALQTNAGARTFIVSAAARSIQSASPDVEVVSSVPYGSLWLAAMVAHELSKPLLTPVEIGPGVGSVQRSVRFGARTWIIDADPDADPQGHMLQAAETIHSSMGIGCEIVGMLAVVERDGRTRAACLQRFPKTVFHAALDVRAALRELIQGAMPRAVRPEDAKRALRLLALSSSIPPATRPPSSST